MIVKRLMWVAVAFAAFGAFAAIMAGNWLAVIFALAAVAHSTAAALWAPRFVPRGGNATQSAATLVDMRSMRTPAKHWQAVVRYDAWGAPYTVGNGSGASYGEVALSADGTTSETHLYGTEWRHRSGPPVTFTERPVTPFPKEYAAY